MVSTFEDAGIPVYYNYSLPLKGTPVSDAMETMLRIGSGEGTLHDALGLLKNPMIWPDSFSEEWNDLQKNSAYLGETITRWGDAHIAQYKKKIACEKERGGEIKNEKAREKILKELELLEKYLASVAGGAIVSALTEDGTLGEYSQIVLGHMKKCRIMDGIRDPMAITNQSFTVKAASRVYFNIEKILLEMERDGTGLNLTRSEFLTLLRDEMSRHMRKVDSHSPDGVQLLTYEEGEHSPAPYHTRRGTEHIPRTPGEHPPRGPGKAERDTGKEPRYQGCRCQVIASLSLQWCE